MAEVTEKENISLFQDLQQRQLDKAIDPIAAASGQLFDLSPPCTGQFWFGRLPFYFLILLIQLEFI